ncbi:hypothetical protein PIB30_090086 [Stylosanthes scabra]|uniref:Uncharacterized protein n=1 Tax=Stylosanthes scabra TaxID=79078 RepID=A0ABU6WU67_9FABA|nr:hypothetical protein [Stylosanthes scabra]
MRKKTSWVCYVRVLPADLTRKKYAENLFTLNSPVNSSQNPPVTSASKSASNERVSFSDTGFANEHLLDSNSKVSMEGEHMQKNLSLATRTCIEAAAICQATQNELKSHRLLSYMEYKQLKTRIATSEAEVVELKNENGIYHLKIKELEGRLLLEKKDGEELKTRLGKSEEGRKSFFEKNKELSREIKTIASEKNKLPEDHDCATEENVQTSANILAVVEEIMVNIKKQIKVVEPKFNVYVLDPDKTIIDGQIVVPSK